MELNTIALRSWGCCLNVHCAGIPDWHAMQARLRFWISGGEGVASCVAAAESCSIAHQRLHSYQTRHTVDLLFAVRSPYVVVQILCPHVQIRWTIYKSIIDYSMVSWTTCTSPTVPHLPRSGAHTSHTTQWHTSHTTTLTTQWCTYLTHPTMTHITHRTAFTTQWCTYLAHHTVTRITNCTTHHAVTLICWF